MIRPNDRVRFVDNEKDKKYGVLTVFSVKNGFALVAKGDYANLGDHKMTVELVELKKEKYP